MTELIFIFIQLLMFIFLFSLNILAISNRYHQNFRISFFENITFNILVNINIILFLSFFNFNLSEIINIYLFLLGLIFLFSLRKPNTIIDYKNFNLYFLFLICIVLFIDIAFNLSFSWDAEKFWFKKTLNFFDNNSIENLKNVAHSFYPHLGTLLWALYWKISLIDYEYSGRLFYSFIYVSSILLLSDILKTNFVIKSIFAILFIFLTYEYYLVSSGNQEILIFSLIAISMNYFHKLSNKSIKNQNFNIIVLLLICNSMIWIKQEGVVFSLIIILTLIFFFNLNLKKRILILISYFIFFIIRILIHKFYNFESIVHVGFQNDFSIMGIIDKISFSRILLIIKFFFLSFFKNYLLDIGLIVLIFALFNKKFSLKISYIYFFALLNFSFVFVTYLMTDTDRDLLFMLKTGVDRLIYQFSPFIFLLIIEYINNFSKKREVY